MIRNAVRSSGRSTLCALALGLLGIGVMIGFGKITKLGLPCVIVALVLAALALRRGRWEQSRLWWAASAALVGVGNLWYARQLPGNTAVQFVLAAVVVVSVAVAAWLPSGSKAWVSIGVAAAALLALAATAWTWGHVNIDVYDAVSGAANDVMHGRNPYLATVSFYYEPTPLHGAQTSAHFPYGPDVAVLAVPGQVLGDVRVMSVLAIAAMLAGLWWLARQGLHRDSGHRIVALGVASPLSVGMVLFAWVDVYMMAFLVGWLALRRSHRRWSIVLLAAAMLVKPLALVVLVPWLVWSKRARLEILIAAVGAFIFALPFALGVGLQTFAYDIVGVQLDLPPRFGALTLVAFVWKITHTTLPSLVSILGVAALVAAIAWRGRPTDEADLSVQATVLSIASFLLAKWALFNYYFISEVMILVAVAAVGVRFAPGEVRLPLALFAQRMRRRSGVSAHAAGFHPAGRLNLPSNACINEQRVRNQAPP